MKLFDPLAVVKAKVFAYVGIGAALALLAALVWGGFEHSWRVKAEDRLNSIRITLDGAMGNKKPTKDKDLPDGVKGMAADLDRQAARADRAEAVVDLQTASIDRLEQETEIAARKSAADQKLIRATLRERDTWIKRAKEAETRVERLAAEQELKQCEDVLDSLYYSGF